MKGTFRLLLKGNLEEEEEDLWQEKETSAPAANESSLPFSRIGAILLLFAEAGMKRREEGEKSSKALD